MHARKSVMAMAGTLVVATGLLFGCNSSNSPSGPSGDVNLNGRVVRSADNAPIAGASILVDGQDKGVVTNAAGNFTLSLAADRQTIAVRVNGNASTPMTVGTNGVKDLNVTFELEDNGRLKSHEDVNDDNGIDENDDIDDDKDVDDDDADGDIDDDGDIDVDEDIDDDGDDDIGDDADEDVNDDGVNDDGQDDEGDDDVDDDPNDDENDD